LALDYLYEDLERVQERHQSDWPNILVISGDLTTKYSPKEYFQAKKFIKEVQDLFKLKDENVCIVPGNHDVSLPKRRKAFDNKDLPPYFYEEEFRKKMGARLIREEAGKPYTWGFYPELRLIIFGFDSNILVPEDIKNFTLDSELFEQCLMSGRIGKEQLDLYENFCSTMEEDTDDFDKITKIAVLHHHVIPIPSEEIKAFNILTDAGSFLEKLAQTDIDMILHGHEHCPFIAKIQYNMGLEDEYKEKDMLILGAGSAGTDRLSYSKEVGNHYSIIKISNWCAKVEPIKVDVEWRYNKEKKWKFTAFSGMKPIELKEKVRMDRDQLRLEQARGYKLEKIKFDLTIEDNGHWKITTEVHAVSTTRRLYELEHFFWFDGEPEDVEYEKPKIEHLEGEEINEEPSLEPLDKKYYLYVIPKNPLALGEKTRYKFTEKFNFKGFCMSLEDPELKQTENVDKFFEFFGFQAVRTVDNLEIKVNFPDKFLKSIGKPAFRKATIGDERLSASDTGETKKIELITSENTIKMKAQDLEYSMNYLLCWYLPKKWPV
jgi:predicted phosphodiesterase